MGGPGRGVGPAGEPAPAPTGARGADPPRRRLGWRGWALLAANLVALAVVAVLLLMPSGEESAPAVDPAAEVSATGTVAPGWDGAPVLVADDGTPYVLAGVAPRDVARAGRGRTRLTGEVGRPLPGAEGVPVVDVRGLASVGEAARRAPGPPPLPSGNTVSGVRDVAVARGAALRVDGLPATTTTTADGTARWDSRTVRDGWHLLAAVPADAVAATPAHAWVRVANGAGPPDPLPGRPVFADDFESGNLGRWGVVQAVGRRAARVVDGPARDGARSARFEVRQGDDPIDSSGDRSEVSELTGEQEGQERWYALSVLPGQGFPGTGLWQVIAQWHSTADGPPPVALYVMDGDLVLQVNRHAAPGRPLETAFPWRGPLASGRWHDLVLRVVWSGSDDRGLVQLWVDGVQVLAPVHVRTLYPGLGNYMKIGYYRNESITATGVIFHDAVRVTQTAP